MSFVLFCFVVLSFSRTGGIFFFTLISAKQSFSDENYEYKL